MEVRINKQWGNASMKNYLSHEVVRQGEFGSRTLGKLFLALPGIGTLSARLTHS